MPKIYSAPFSTPGVVRLVSRAEDWGDVLELIRADMDGKDRNAAKRLSEQIDEALSRKGHPVRVTISVMPEDAEWLMSRLSPT